MRAARVGNKIPFSFLSLFLLPFLSACGSFGPFFFEQKTSRLGQTGGGRGVASCLFFIQTKKKTRERRKRLLLALRMHAHSLTFNRTQRFFFPLTLCKQSSRWCPESRSGGKEASLWPQLARKRRIGLFDSRLWLSRLRVGLRRLARRRLPHPGL